MLAILPLAAAPAVAAPAAGAVVLRGAVEVPAPEPAPAPAPDSAAPTPPPSESPEPDLAPTILSSPADGAQLDGTATVSGTAQPGSSVQIQVGGSTEPACIVTADADGAFTCDLSDLESTPSTTVRAVALLPGGGTADATVTVRILTAPVVTGGPRGALTNAVVQGSAYPGATVSATASGFGCTSTADTSGAWSCPLGDGITDGDHLVSATQSTEWSDGDSPASAPIAITVDATVPSAPVLQSPSARGTLPLTGAVFSGLGEGGATVSVFAGAHMLCDAAVASGGAWSCRAGTVPAGTYNLAVLQQDAAGNVSVQSGALVMTFAAGTPTPRPTGGATTPTSPGGAVPAPGATQGGSGSGAPGSGGSGDSGAGEAGSGETGTEAPGSGAPGSGGSTGSGSGSGEPGGGSASGPVVTIPDSWSNATSFSASLQPAFGSAAAPLWWVALVLAAAALLLVALPARLLEKALRPTPKPAHPQPIRPASPPPTPARTSASASASASATGSHPGALAPTGSTRATFPQTGSALGATTATGFDQGAFTQTGSGLGASTGGGWGRGVSTGTGPVLIGRVLGRNRVGEEFERAPDVQVGPWATRAAALLASAAIVTLSGPVANEPAYLRLFVSVVAAVVVVNVAATVLPAVLARAAFGIRSTVRLRPALLLVSAAFALVSRVAEVEPALVFGLVAGLALAVPATEVARLSSSARRAARAAPTRSPLLERHAWGRLATVQVIVLVVVGGVAWAASGLVDAAGPQAFWAVGGSELLHTVVLAAFGSASLLLVPVGRTSGRRILEWSPATWLLLALASFASLTMLFVPSLTELAAGGGLVPLALVMLGCAALCVSVWVWQRFVATADDD
ncbi:hypothetical protein [Herbiconiux liukaitaii]|uniref:hypothetical protein n=1 Tax=Herbiconiux liukaitaii TaxID=3342799 RepID=UPI0035B7152A